MMVDISRRLVVIIGGGAVAARKACGVLEAGAERVVCVAPRFADSIPTRVQRIKADYRPEHLEGAGLVFAATDSAQVNDAVLVDARSRNILVCRADADADDPGDFATPARFQQGEVVITVSAGGNPALAVAIRNALAAHVDARWSVMAGAMRTLRPMILRADGLTQTQRREIFRQLASETALDVLARDGLSGLKLWLAERYPELSHG